MLLSRLSTEKIFALARSERKTLYVIVLEWHTSARFADAFSLFRRDHHYLTTLQSESSCRMASQYYEFYRGST